jgi:hypothetical protein
VNDVDLVRRSVPLPADVPDVLDDEADVGQQLVMLLRAVGLERTALLVDAGERHGPTITALAGREMADVAGRRCPACGR